MVEEKAWKDLENGAERVAWVKQNDALMDQYMTNSVKVKELTIRADNNKAEIQNKIENNKAYDSTLETRKGENQVLHK